MNGRSFSASSLSRGTIEFLSQSCAEKKLLFSYRTFIRERRMIENSRPTLLGTFGIKAGIPDAEISMRLMQAFQDDILFDEDRKVLRDYLVNIELKGIVDVALSERLAGKKAGRDRRIIEDLFFEKMSFEDAAGKYGLSIITIKRTKKKGIEAVRKEIQFRLRLQDRSGEMNMCPGRK